MLATTGTVYKPRGIYHLFEDGNCVTNTLSSELR